jgi:hypothetical protein
MRRKKSPYFFVQYGVFLKMRIANAEMRSVNFLISGIEKQKDGFGD